MGFGRCDSMDSSGGVSNSVLGDCLIIGNTRTELKGYPTSSACVHLANQCISCIRHYGQMQTSSTWSLIRCPYPLLSDHNMKSTMAELNQDSTGMKHLSVPHGAPPAPRFQVPQSPGKTSQDNRSTGSGSKNTEPAEWREGAENFVLFLRIFYFVGNLTGNLLYFDRGAWQPTTLNMMVRDFCAVMYDKKQLWYSDWSSHVANSDEIKDNCIKVPGTLFLIETYNLKLVFGSGIPLGTGRYSIRVQVFAYDQKGKKRPNDVCYEVKGSFYKRT